MEDITKEKIREILRGKQKRNQLDSTWPIYTQAVIPIYYMVDDLVNRAFLMVIATTKYLPHLISSIFLSLFTGKKNIFFQTL